MWLCSTPIPDLTGAYLIQMLPLHTLHFTNVQYHSEAALRDSKLSLLQVVKAGINDGALRDVVLHMSYNFWTAEDMLEVERLSKRRVFDYILSPQYEAQPGLGF